MTTTADNELATALSELDWGAGATRVQPVLEPRGELEIDVSVPGVREVPARVKRSHHKPKTVVVVGESEPRSTVVEQVEPAPVPQGAVAAAGSVRTRRPKDAAPDVLVLAGEGPAVVALFEAMWRESGHQLALGIQRPKASKQDAAIGWYMFLQAMRQRDARAG